MPSPSQFIRDLVHATLQDAKGYVEGLSEELVDRFIDCIERKWTEHDRPEKECAEASEALQTKLAQLQQTVERVVTSAQTPDGKAVVPSYARLHILKEVREEADRLEKRLLDLEAVESRLERDVNPFRKVTAHSTAVVQETNSEANKQGEGEQVKSHAEEKVAMDEEPSGKGASKRKFDAEETISGISDKESKEDGARDAIPNLVQSSSSPTTSDMEIENQTSASTNVENETEQEKNRDKEEAGPLLEEEEAEASEDSSTGEVEIERVAVDVRKRHDDVSRLRTVASMMTKDELMKDPKLSHELVKDLHKHCSAQSQALMNDLMLLDQVVTTSHVRPKRKEQVNAIQVMLDSLQEVMSQLEELDKSLKEAVTKMEEQKSKGATIATKTSQEAEEKRAAKLKEEEVRVKERREQLKKQIEAQNAAESERRAKQTATLKKALDADMTGPSLRDLDLVGLWRSLRLEPQLHIDETENEYSMAMYIPGIRDEDLSIRLDDEGGLQVEGCRLPTGECAM